MRLPLRLLPGNMPEVEDLNDSALLLNAVVDSYWRMKDLAHPSPLVDGRADVWKSGQKLDVIEKSVTESCRRLWIIGEDVID